VPQFLAKPLCAYAHVNLEELRQAALPCPKQRNETDDVCTGASLLAYRRALGFELRARHPAPELARYADGSGIAPLDYRIGDPLGKPAAQKQIAATGFALGDHPPFLPDTSC